MHRKHGLSALKSTLYACQLWIFMTQATVQTQIFYTLKVNSIRALIVSEATVSVMQARISQWRLMGMRHSVEWHLVDLP